MARQEIDLTTPQPNGRMGEPTKSAWEKVNDMTLEIYEELETSDSSRAGFITGFKLEKTAARTVRVSSGVAHIESSNSIAQSNSSITKSFTLSGPSFGYVYIYILPNGDSDIEVSNVVPSNPYFGTARSKSGDASKRFLGCLFIDAAGNIVPFIMVGNFISYLNAWAPSNRFLSNGQQVSNTTVSASVYVPPVARLVKLYAQNTSTTSSVNLRAFDDSSSSYSQIFSIDPAPASGLTSSQIFEFSLSQSREMQYMHSATPNGGAFLNIAGYFFER